MSGFVSFVSSGPGDPELLTLKAVARLQAADAVLFDDLSSGPDSRRMSAPGPIWSASASAPDGCRRASNMSAGYWSITRRRMRRWCG